MHLAAYTAERVWMIRCRQLGNTADHPQPTWGWQGGQNIGCPTFAPVHRKPHPHLSTTSTSPFGCVRVSNDVAEHASKHQAGDKQAQQRALSLRGETTHQDKQLNSKPVLYGPCASCIPMVPVCAPHQPPPSQKPNHMSTSGAPPPIPPSPLQCV